MPKNNIAIGIDLGTTYACVAIYRNQKVEVIPDVFGNTTMPSIVAFNDKECLVGEVARKQALSNIANTVFDVKRLIGRRYDDEFVQKDKDRWPFSVVNVDGKAQVRVQFQGKTHDFLPQRISAFILAEAKKNAEAFLGSEVKDAVITVPAYFNQAQREATMDAGRIAGLNVLRIISEPTAAAVAYGFNKHFSNETKRNMRNNSKPINLLVYDLGGGTFDVSILSIEANIFDVLATAGDTHLGGNNFDDKLVEHFVEAFRRKHQSDCTKNRRAMHRLRLQCEEAKRELTSAEETQLSLDCFIGSVDFNPQITRVRFENLCENLFQQTITHLECALKEAHLTKDQIDHFVIVGGSTRIPRIHEILQNYFGKDKKLSRDINGEEAVAHGAAIQAAMLSSGAQGNEPEIVIHDATNLSLGIETEGGMMAVMIPKNKQIPARASKSFTTVRDYQQKVTLSIFQGERPMTRDNFHLAEFSLTDILPAPKGESDFLVTFEVDVNCMLKVTAVDQKTKKSKEVVISHHKFKLTDEEINRYLKEAEDKKEIDKKEKERVDARVDLETYLLETKAEAKKKTNIKQDNKTRVLKKIEETLEWIDSNALQEASVFRQRQDELAKCFASLLV